MFARSKFLALAGSLLVSAFAVSIPMSTACAQDAPQYDQLPYKEAPATTRSGISKVLRGDLPLDAYKDKVDGFFQSYIFAGWTLPENLGTIAQERQNFFNRYVRAARSDEARKHLTNLTLTTMKGLIAGNYHPAVRYNATLVIGDLDQTLAVEFGGDKRPPVPLPEALPVLLIAYKSPQLPDVVKIAANLGIQRHVRYNYTNFKEAEREEISRLMLELASQQDPPEGRTASGHQWMRRMAIETLALMQQPGGNNEVVGAFQGVVNERRSPLWLRGDAASAIGKLKYDTRDTRLDVQQINKSLAQLALDACTYERAVSQRDAMPPSRIRLAHHLTSVREGLDGPAQLASGDTAQAVTGLTQQIDGVLDELKSKEAGEGVIAPLLIKTTTALQPFLGAAEPEAKPAAKPADEAAPTPKPGAAKPPTTDPFSSLDFPNDVGWRQTNRAIGGTSIAGELLLS